MASQRQKNYIDSNKPSQKLSPEKYARLRAEAEAPYRSLRKFVYIACGISGLLGAFVFLAQLIAGRDVGSDLPNLAIQLGVVGLMIFLFRLESRTRKDS
ncbi:MAG: DUF3493 domain-containing protein [Leptolyngbyaceae bacterium]|nr:DUF3493 domain-containing protein [Leptolyngbyaceae bacterium]